ncbi:MAG: creatininase family protein [Thermomicrobiales bacterium]|nr:creatininase family protein [Thermomicrobiales bacterium]
MTDTTKPIRPTSPEVRLERMTGGPVEEGQFDKAILGLGATEYHGPHLPYGTDTFTAETWAEAVARELGNTLVLPTLAYGVSHHHLAWPWTLSLRPETLSSVIVDIGESLLHHGITKLIIVPAHDGNPAPAETAARLLSQKHDMKVALVDGVMGKAREMLAGRFDIDGDHAGRTEMSMVLYSNPETTRHDLATSEQTQFVDLPILLIDSFKGTVPKGFSGDAAAGSAEEGQAMTEAMVAILVPFLRELDKRGWKRGTWMSRIDE